MAINNKVQLITYPDSLGGNLRALHHVLNTSLASVFEGGVHILPPFPSSGDRGFAPLTYLEIEPTFGTWDDISAIGEQHDVLLDLMVNHISRHSPYFRDFVQRGRRSPYAAMFLTLDSMWPDGEPVQEDIDMMFLRREAPYSTYTIEETGEQENVWTTFGKTDPSEQIDLDIHSPQVRELFRAFFANFKRNRVSIVRLDAVGYVIKKLGTSCFFVEPDIYEFLDWMRELANEHGIELLPEVHAHYSIQYKLAERGWWIYDFILPYRILDTLVNGSSSDLTQYLKTRPAKQFTMLDCHDGIPVKPDMDGLIDSGQAQRIVDICVQRGANLSKIVSDDHKDRDGFDVHQIRCTFYSALDCNDDAYIAARAIQFFTPGVPQVYYVGLLAGENDLARVEETGEGREINRQNYTTEDIEHALDKEVVQRLLRLIRFRNEYDAFHGKFEVLPSADGEVRLAWTNESARCELHVGLAGMKTEIIFRNERGEDEVYIA